MKPAYYSEWDPYAAQWLRNLIAADLIAPGDVDERSIVDVKADDLKGYGQVHLFAGIGGWSLACRLAGIPDDRPLWTGSCPCPPFSTAGQTTACATCNGRRLVWCPRRTGYVICAICKTSWHADDRHLWPEFWRLISECRPGRVFGEQVASEAGLVWLAGVRGSLEILGYDVGAADLPACSVGAPHIRKRAWWMAHAHGRNGGDGHLQRRREHREQPSHRQAVGGVVHPERQRGRRGPTRIQHAAYVGQPGETRWGDHYVRCADERSRRIEPSIQPLVNGIPGRLGRLRAFGNAIVPQVAAEFIQAAYEARP